MPIQDILNPIGMIGGAIAGGAWNAFSQNQTNQMTRGMFDDKLWWQEKMAGTAYQRSVHDMKKAGLNPLLMMGKGGAAQTPSASQPSLKAPSIGDSVSRGVSSALEKRRLDKDIEMTDSSIGLQKAGTKAKKAEEKLLSARLPGTRANSAVDVARGAYNKKYAGADALIDRAGRALGIVPNAIGKFFRPDPAERRDKREFKKLKKAGRRGQPVRRRPTFKKPRRLK